MRRACAPFSLPQRLASGARRRSPVRRAAGVAVVDVATEIRGLAHAPAGVQLGSDGVMRTRLLQVFVRRDGAWWIEAYHTIDVRPPAPVTPVAPAAAAPAH